MGLAGRTSGNAAKGYAETFGDAPVRESVSPSNAYTNRDSEQSFNMKGSSFNVRQNQQKLVSSELRNSINDQTQVDEQQAE